MVGDAFRGPGVVDEGREAEAGVRGGDRRAGPEDPLREGLPTAGLAGSRFPCEVALERAELSGAASSPAGLCSEAGLASLLTQQGGRKRGEGKGSKG